MPKKKPPGLSASAMRDLKQLSPAQQVRATGGGTRHTTHQRTDSIFTKDVSVRDRFRADSVLLAMKHKHEREMANMQLEIAKMQARTGQRAVGSPVGGGAGTSVNVVGGAVGAGAGKKALQGASKVFGRQGSLARGAAAAAGLLGGGKAKVAGKLARAVPVRALLKP